MPDTDHRLINVNQYIFTDLPIGNLLGIAQQLIKVESPVCAQTKRQAKGYEEIWRNQIKMQKSTYNKR